MAVTRNKRECLLSRKAYSAILYKIVRVYDDASSCLIGRLKDSSTTVVTLHNTQTPASAVYVRQVHTT